MKKRTSIRSLSSLHTQSLSSFLVEDKYRVYRHLLVQVFILIISIGNFFDAPDRLNLSLNRIYGWFGYYIFLNVLVYFNAYVLFPCFLAKNKINTYIGSAILFIFGMGCVMILLEENFYDIAVIHHEPSVAAIMLNIASSLLAMLLFIGGIATLLSLKQWMTDNRHITDLRAATTESELKYLKSQINPHFLFNMLNNANILIEDEPDRAIAILANLNELLGYQLNGSLQEKVRLDDEIRFLSNYLELEKTRRDHFEYTLTQEGKSDAVEVAPLLFIPFVENAVKHNIPDQIGSFVEISFCLQAGELTFICRNSISEEAVSFKDRGGLGLLNIKRRLDLLFGDTYRLEQTKNHSVYTVKLEIKV